MCVIVLLQIEAGQGELLAQFQLVLMSCAKLGTGATHKLLVCSMSVMWLGPHMSTNENNVFLCVWDPHQHYLMTIIQTNGHPQFAHEFSTF